MISKQVKLRVARPTDKLAAISRMYIDGLDFRMLGKFDGHDGFDGVIIGHEAHGFHLEFTHHRGTLVGNAPTKDNLLVFYIAALPEWESACDAMLAAGFKSAVSYNPYWDVAGKTFEDLDGYRVVLQNRDWTA